MAQVAATTVEQTPPTTTKTSSSTVQWLDLRDNHMSDRYDEQDNDPEILLKPSEILLKALRLRHMAMLAAAVTTTTAKGISQDAQQRQRQNEWSLTLRLGGCALPTEIATSLHAVLSAVWPPPRDLTPVLVENGQRADSQHDNHQQQHEPQVLLPPLAAWLAGQGGSHVELECSDQLAL